MFTLGGGGSGWAGRGGRRVSDVGNVPVLDLGSNCVGMSAL